MQFGENWINVFGVPVILEARANVVKWCAERIAQNKQTWIVTANPEILLRARKNSAFKKQICGARLITPDGAGVCWAAKFIHLTENSTDLFEIIGIFFVSLWTAIFSKRSLVIFPERVSGADLLWNIAEIARDNKNKVYLIGGENGTALKAAARIRAEYKGLNIDAFAPNHVATPYSCYELHNELEAKRPAIVFVAYGSPKQEEWICQNLHRYPSIILVIGVGGALDFIAGNISRAPLRLQYHALEWIWRLYQRPTRFLRVLRAIAVFPTFILLSRLKRYVK